MKRTLTIDRPGASMKGFLAGLLMGTAFLVFAIIIPGMISVAF